MDGNDRGIRTERARDTHMIPWWLVLNMEPVDVDTYLPKDDSNALLCSLIYARDLLSIWGDE